MLDRVRKTMAGDPEERHKEQEERKRQIEEEVQKEEAKKQETPTKQEVEEKKGAPAVKDEAAEGKKEEKSGTTGPTPSKAPKGSTGQATGKKKPARQNQFK